MKKKKRLCKIAYVYVLLFIFPFLSFLKKFLICRYRFENTPPNELAAMRIPQLLETLRTKDKGGLFSREGGSGLRLRISSSSSFRLHFPLHFLLLVLFWHALIKFLFLVPDVQKLLSEVQPSDGLCQPIYLVLPADFLVSFLSVNCFPAAPLLCTIFATSCFHVGSRILSHVLAVIDK